jgi:hypothetical protein
MGFRLDGYVGTNIMGDGSQQGALARFGRDGSLVVCENHGKYFEQALRGNMYVASTLTAGIALIVSATTGNCPTLWNPLGSGVNAEIVRLSVTYISGVTAPTALYWMITSPAGSAIATGAPIATFTAVAAANLLIGQGKVSSCRWAPAICTFTAAPAYYTATGIGLGTGAPTVVPSVINVDYDGLLVIPPGTAISLCSQAATTTALYAVSLYYGEQVF